MTILSIVQGVCPRIGLEIPSEAHANTTREIVELIALLRDTASMIAHFHPWRLLSAVATITGDGTTESWSLPADYDWIPDDSQFWSTSLSGPLQRIQSTDEWLGLDVQQFDYVYNAWIIYGGQVHTRPAIASGVLAKYFYQGNKIYANAAGTAAATTSVDTDTFRLGERLLTLGVIWRWKMDKGLPYAEHMQDFEGEKEKLIARDRGGKVLKIGRRAGMRDVDVAYPRTIVT